MARQKIREFDAKRLISTFISSKGIPLSFQSIPISPHTDLEMLPFHYPWVHDQKLVIKPDQLFGKRKQYGLVYFPATFDLVKAWLREHQQKQCTIGKATDSLTHFLLEPHIEHTQEFYTSITSTRDADIVQFSLEGGMNIEERWETMARLSIPVPEVLTVEKAEAFLANNAFVDKVIGPSQRAVLAKFVAALHEAYVTLNFSSLEINPFTFDSQQQITPLDMVAELDDCAEFKNRALWEQVEFPRPFGRMYFPEEEFIHSLDKDSGASLKLTMLNPKGRIWNILSGGGASIVILDSLVTAGLGHEIANYGEYSGNPTTEESYLYAKTILQLMTNNPSFKGRILLIAGAIANFTDIEATFKGVVRALEEYGTLLREQQATLYVRRGGPNDQKGLALIQKTAEHIGLRAHIAGPEMPMTTIVHVLASQLKSQLDTASSSPPAKMVAP